MRLYRKYSCEFGSIAKNSPCSMNRDPTFFIPGQRSRISFCDSCCLKIKWSVLSEMKRSMTRMKSLLTHDCIRSLQTFRMQSVRFRQTKEKYMSLTVGNSLKSLTSQKNYLFLQMLFADS